MIISFDEQDWLRVEDTWKNFWSGTLQRPIVWMEYSDKPFHRKSEYRRYYPQYDNNVSVDEIVSLDAERLAATRFGGDSLPKVFINFGPGSAAAYMGSRVDTANDTIWFHSLEKELADFDIHVDKEGYWYNRIMEIIKGITERFDGLVQTSFSDIGGNLDILASLRGTQNLATDLYDEPDLVDRLLKNITDEWLKIYDDEYRVISKKCRGTSTWSPVWSPGKTYMLQSDFCYMISSEMFHRFVLPDLQRCCNMLDHSFYHLDGPGELTHLDALCNIKNLHGIQWIPGAGHPPAENWPEVLSKIITSGKKCQVFVSPEGAKKIVREHGGEGFILCVELKQDQKSDADQILTALGWKE